MATQTTQRTPSHPSQTFSRLSRVCTFFSRKLTTLILFTMISILLVGIFAPLSHVGAAEPPKTDTKSPSYETMNPADQARSFTHFRTLQDCWGDSASNGIYPDPKDDGQIQPTDKNSPWFSGSSASGTVYDKGKQDCTVIMKQALKLWGITDIKQFLQGIGYLWEPMRPSYTGEREKLKKGFTAFYKKTIDKDVDSRFKRQDTAAEYSLYLQAFTTTCKARDLGPYDSLNETYKGWVDSERQASEDVDVGASEAGVSKTKYWQYRKINLASPEGVIPHGFLYYRDVNASYDTSSNDKSIKAPLWGAKNHLVEKSCDDIADALNKGLSKAYAKFLSEHGEDSSLDKTTSDDCDGGSDCGNKDSCRVEGGLGWIVCPVTIFLANITTGAYKNILEPMLEISRINMNPETNPGNSDYNPLYAAWSHLRDLANAGLVLVFLISIYRVLFSTGSIGVALGSKTLRRLIIIAIGLNMSYFICALAIDLANIIGRGGYVVFQSLANGVQIPADSPASTYLASGAERVPAPDWGVIVGAVFVLGGVVLMGVLGVLGPILLAAATAALIVVVVLTLRQALVVVLLVLAPLAILSYALEGTQAVFKKWLSLFRSMLTLYVTIAVIFGLSAFAGKILMANSNDMIMQIVGAGAMIIPMVLVPFVMKSSTQLLGKLGAKLQGKVAARASSAYSSSRLGRRDASLAEQRAQNKLMAQGGAYAGKNPFRRAQSSLNKGISSLPGVRKSAVTRNLQTAGYAAAEKRDTEELKATQSMLLADTTNYGTTAQQETGLRAAITSGDTVRQKALANILVDQGGGGIDAIARATDASTADDVSDLRMHLARNHAPAIKEKNAALMHFASRATGTQTQANSAAAVYPGISEAQLATQTAETIARHALHISHQAAQGVLRNKRLNLNLDQQQRTELSRI